MSRANALNSSPAPTDSATQADHALAAKDCRCRRMVTARATCPRPSRVASTVISCSSASRGHAGAGWSGAGRRTVRAEVDQHGAVPVTAPDREVVDADDADLKISKQRL